MKVKMVLFDLDGTLLNSRKEITAETHRALVQAAQAGVELIPSTGRYFLGIPEAVRELPFIHYAVTVNGAQVVDTATGAPLYRAEIPYAQAEQIWQELDKLPGFWDCYYGDQGFMDAADYARLDEFLHDPALLAMVRRLRRQVPDLRQWLQLHKPDIQKTQIFLRTHAEQQKAMEHLKAVFPTLQLTNSIPTNIEINAPGASKGAALEFLREHLGLPKAQTMAIGDSTNDASMIRAAGVGVAMGNALPELKEIADFVTETNDQNGVALAIRRFCLSE